jgi:hypothetical protein
MNSSRLSKAPSSFPHPIPTPPAKIELNFGFTKKDRAAVRPVPHADTLLLTVNTPPSNPRALLPCSGDEALSGDPFEENRYPRAQKGSPQPLVASQAIEFARALLRRGVV